MHINKTLLGLALAMGSAYTGKTAEIPTTLTDAGVPQRISTKPSGVRAAKRAARKARKRSR